jgi:hypothetical protein
MFAHPLGPTHRCAPAGVRRGQATDSPNCFSRVRQPNLTPLRGTIWESDACIPLAGSEHRSGRSRNRNPRTAPVAPHEPNAHLRAADLDDPFLAFAVPLDRLAYCRRGKPPNRACIWISVLLGITHFAASSIQHWASQETTLTHYGTWPYGNSDKRNKLCIGPRRFPHAPACPDCPEVPTPGGIRTRYATLALVGPRATLGRRAKGRRWASHVANVRKRGPHAGSGPRTSFFFLPPPCAHACTRAGGRARAGAREREKEERE